MSEEQTFRDWARVLQADQARRWQGGRPAPVEDYLEQYPSLRADPEAVLQLINNEVVLREEAGEGPRLEDYLRRFPHLDAALRDLFAVHRVLESSEPLFADDAPSGGVTPSPSVTPDGCVSSPRSAGAADSVPGRPANGLAVRGYEVVGELGRGGMGVVYQARDPALGRDIAIKVLREDYRGRPDAEQRFLAEAQVTGQLQHPGVPPVHQVGRLADGRPFLAMKLIQGRTLAELLQERASPGDDLPRFLAVFEQACQAVAYAHSRGVIHRDLKPANVMVGAFGEVQVLDWGLAKVRPAAGAAEETGAAEPSTVSTVRTAAPGLSSQDGAVLGTLAYMAPEQARGEAERLDERCDVFGLGAILCEVLTGQPPYRGASRGEVGLRAARADLADARSRLEGSGADAELVRLARACLAAEPDGRPRDAGAVAAALAASQAGTRHRLRQAELERAAAEARAEQAQAREAAERRARRRTVLLLLAGAVLTGVCGAGAWWALRQAEAEAGRRALAATKAEEVRQEFDAAGPEALRLQEAGKYQEAEAVVQRLEGLTQAGAGGPDLPARVAQLRAHLTMLADLERTRLEKAELAADGRRYDSRRAAPLYRKAFRRYGLDVLAGGPAEAAKEVQDRPIREALLAALADWAAVTPDAEERARLLRVGGAAGPASGAFGRRWREAVEKKDGPGLARLAGTPEAERLPAASVVRLSQDLSRLGAREAAVRLLREARRRDPGDFWLNVELAWRLERTEPREAVRFWTAAVALRPQSAGTHLNLGTALRDQKDPAGAVRAFRQAIHLGPQFALAHLNLGVALRDQNDLAGAIAAYRAAIRLEPAYALAHYNLGTALRDQKDLAGAEAAFRAAVRLAPNFAHAHNNLGVARADRNDLAGAVAAFRAALRLAPNFAQASNNLGSALAKQGDLPAAVAAYREAIRLAPKLVTAHNNLGKALLDQKDLPGAIQACREAIRLEPGHALSHLNLGNALHAKGDLAGAAQAYREAIRLGPPYAPAHRNLGLALQAQKDLPGAIKAYREAIRLDRQFARAYTNLGNALLEQKDLAGAIAAYCAVLRLEPTSAPAHCDLGVALHAQKDLAGAVAAHRAAIRLDPSYAPAHNNLGTALRDQKDLAGAAREFRAAICLSPNDAAPAYYNLGVVLAAQKDDAGAARAFRAAICLDPNHARAYANLGNALSRQKDLPGAVQAYCAAIRLEPTYALAHYNLGLALHNQRDLDGAVGAYREAIRLGLNDTRAHTSLGMALEEQGDLDGAVQSFLAAIRLAPHDALAHCRLGLALRDKGQFAEALVALKRGDELGRQGPAWPHPSREWVKGCERLLELDRRLPAALRGEGPVTADEQLAFANLCLRYKERYAAAARFFTGAFVEQPKFADDLGAYHRYNAACAALLASAGGGKDAGKLDEKERARLRGQALDWLRADLTQWATRPDGGRREGRAEVQRELEHWQKDPFLAGARDEGKLGPLPEAERQAWRQLWRDVAALRKRAAGAK
jgi:tetratricopeptide (TPR) repeat protein